MGDAVRRSKRVVKTACSKDENSTQAPRKWSDDEVKALYDCLIKYGHKNFDKMQECLPRRSLENIKNFLRTIHHTATQSCGDQKLDAWINRCISASNTKEAPWRDSLQIAQIMKYLSVDGLLESHPLPERCDGIDFSEAYRFLYQILMGYPVQPLSVQTASFIHKTMFELKNEIIKETKAISAVESHCLKNHVTEKDGGSVQLESTINTPEVVNKPLKVYQRKRPNPKENIEKEAPSLKIVVKPNTSEGSNSSLMQDFSVTIEGGAQSTVVNVAVPVARDTQVDEDEQNLLKSNSYNPLEVPDKWLEHFSNISKSL